MNSMLNLFFLQKLEVVPGSISYDIWRVTPMPIVLSFYLYNLTNPKEFEKGKELPNVDEVGPYVYKLVSTF